VLLVQLSRPLFQYGVEDAYIEEKPPCCTFIGADVCKLIVVLFMLTGLILFTIGAVQNEKAYIAGGVVIFILPFVIIGRYKEVCCS